MKKILSKFRNSKLTSRLIFIILSFLIIPFLVFYFYSYLKIENKTKQQIEQITLESNRQISMSIENLLDNVVKTSTYFLSAQNVSNHIKLMQDESTPAYEYLQQYRQLNNTVFSITNTVLPQETIITFASRDHLYYSSVPSNNLRFSEFLAQVSEEFPEVENAMPVFPYYHTSFLSSAPNSSYLSCIRALEPAVSGKTACFLIVSLPTDTFRNILVPANGDFLLTDHQGHVLYATSDIDPVFASDMDYIISAVDIAPYGLHLINAIPSSDIYLEVHKLRNQFLLYISVWTVFFLAVTFCLICHQLRPLTTLKQHMLLIRNGNMNARISSEATYDEIGLLTQTFNSMLDRLNQLIQEIQEKQKLESELRFEMLLAQINPHFLFNTLNSIKWMSIVAQTETITNTITSLGRLLEISMNKMNDIISINDELENIRSYIQIQQIRYAGQFTVKYQIAPELLPLSSPKLILQPIVENAILHNVCANRLLNIMIQGTLENGSVVFHITDNGSGMSSEKIQDILATSSKEKNLVFRGIGIRNVNERIRLLYGESYGISFKSKINHYTQVTIVLPIQNNIGESNKC